MIRTKSLGLLHKQVVKDSCMSRQGLPDYLVVMRKPGVNESPVNGYFDRDDWAGEDQPNPAFKHVMKEGSDCPQVTTIPDEAGDSINIWERYASPVWMDIRQGYTLQYMAGRHKDDNRHISPLQLDVVHRAIDLWSNPGDIVFTPFMGIGTEIYEALKMGRRGVGAELKPSYYALAKRNIAEVADQVTTSDTPLLDLLGGDF